MAGPLEGPATGHSGGFTTVCVSKPSTSGGRALVDSASVSPVATRRRTSTTRRSSTGRSATRRATTGRSGTRRTTRRRNTSTRRRRPRLATTLGSALALGLLAGWLRLGWLGRGLLAAALLVVLIGYFLWSRRGQIHDEMTSGEPERGPATTEPTSTGSGADEPVTPPAGTPHEETPQ